MASENTRGYKNCGENKKTHTKHIQRENGAAGGYSEGRSNLILHHRS